MQKASNDFFLGTFVASVIYTFVLAFTSNYHTTIISGFAVLLAWILFILFKWSESENKIKVFYFVVLVALMAALVLYIFKKFSVG